ncbi:helix-turn-helix domain-containing protein [Aureimonas sp. N4]|uniref:helix-turn-helix domain-containing protein n=1 Tax=Aureimonas sp. N4 TaxID=1638165 RepID=UPI0009E9B839|nr:helix-turn-helix transcriptional regulator [Aureimonas sp. N4]
MNIDKSQDRSEILATRLRQARELAGLSQGQVAKLLSMHRPTISQIEAGQRKVSAEELLRFSDLYDASPDYLLGRTPTTLEADDPRVRFAARELNKLKPEALEGLLKIIASFQEPSSGNKDSK